MARLTTRDMAGRLLGEDFERTVSPAQALTDPVADTAMMVTLDELLPYELDPRITRNPLYDEIKASIRERGLDAPPPITRRPGADHYIIRNGGNTRLAILRELWTETKEERFFRIPCLFRPWPERGEIVALTGHLAENELHGGLTFIERSLGVEKLRELYEQEEDGKPLSQSELARRMRSDGYAVPQPHISRMQEAIQYLLPAIPNILYGGLGRHQVEQLTSLRRSGARIWESRAAAADRNTDFEIVFHTVLAAFDLMPGEFSVERVQDELIGQMADYLDEKYDTLAFEFTIPERRAPMPARPTSEEPPTPAQSTSEEQPVLMPQAARPPSPQQVSDPASVSQAEPFDPAIEAEPDEVDDTDIVDDIDVPGDEVEDADEVVAAQPEQRVATPAPASDRLQSIQQLITDHLNEEPAEPEDSPSRAIPVQAGGLYPITDVWSIDPSIDIPERLRIHIAQCAREIADEAGLADCIADVDYGIGFACMAPTKGEDAPPLTPLSRGVLALLHTLCAPYNPSNPAVRIDTIHLVRDLGPLLLGWPQLGTASALRLSDDGVVKLFRLLRLARRLLELENGVAEGDIAAPSP